MTMTKYLDEKQRGTHAVRRNLVNHGGGCRVNEGTEDTEQQFTLG